MLQVYTPKLLPCDQLLIDPVFIDLGFVISPGHVRLAVDIGVPKQEVIVIGRQVVANPRAKEELFEVAGEIVTAVLYFIVPVPAIIYFLISEVHEPVALHTFLGCQL